jgi:hypothetical protein
LFAPENDANASGPSVQELPGSMTNNALIADLKPTPTTRNKHGPPPSKQ